MAEGMASLDTYRRKRDRTKTPEPFGGDGGPRRRSSSSSATRRAGSTTTSVSNADGALASWAVPKGVPLEPGERALAVHVEDHPLDYATFAGEIPKGQYGGGTVEIWDHGTYELLEEKRNGQLTVRLHGERLEGAWTLVPAPARREGAELAVDPPARRGGRRGRTAAELRADARDPHRRAAAGR